MGPQKKREIIVEFERVQLIRRKALTQLMFCQDCGADVDFVSLREAATLFSTTAEALLQFIHNNQIHFGSGHEAEVLICLTTLLARIKTQTALLKQ